MHKELKRRNPKSKLLLILLSLCICLTGIAIYIYISKREEIRFQNAAKHYVHTLETKQYEKLSSLLDKDSYIRQDFTAQEITKKYDSIFNGIGIVELHASHITTKKVNGGEYDLDYQLSFKTPLGKMENLSYQTKMFQKDGKIYIEWHPSLIFPGMEGQDRVAFHRWKAKRGEIQDHLGNGLAVNADFKLAGIIPMQLGKSEVKGEQLEKISRRFKMPLSAVESKLEQKWVTDETFVPLKVIAKNEAIPIKGVDYQNIKQRYYPLKEAAAQLIGYVGSVTKEDIDNHPYLDEGDVIGKSGLERTYDKQLRGTDGGEILIVDRYGEEKKKIQSKEKSDGDDIKLTIDNYIQKEAYKSLNQKTGATVVMDPKEGGLYALVSSPSFDPNKMAQGISQQEYNKYAEAEEKPFISRFSERYAPGSTFKMITASIGVDHNITYPDKSRIIHGLKWQKDKSWGGYSITRVSDIENVDMEKALIYSDNIYFAQETLEMGEKTFRRGLERFGFDKDLELPIPMKKAQISSKPKFASEISLADTGYGQGELLMTPIQQAAMYSVFQNKGNIVYPKLLKDSKKRKTKQAISESTANTVKNMLFEVVKNPKGTAHILYDGKHDLGAKTGTAELKNKQGEAGNENSFLFAFDGEANRFLMISMAENYKKGESATQLNRNFIRDLYAYMEHR